MPRVPTYDNFQVTANIAPANLIRNPETASAAAFSGRQMQEAGVSLQRAGQTVSAEFEQANKLRAQDAYNQLQIAAQRLSVDPREGYANLKGSEALSRPGGKPLTGEYGSKFDQEFDTIAQSLGNDEQRELFRQAAGNLRTDFTKNLMKYEAEQYKGYAASVNNTTMQLGVDNMILNRRDLNSVAANEAAIRQAAYDTEFTINGDAAGATLKARDAASKAHKALLMTELKDPAGDVAFADEYFKKFGTPEHMDPADALEVGLSLQDAMNKRAAQSISTGVANSLVRNVMPDSVDRMLNIDPDIVEKALSITAQTESGNRNYDSNGNILLGPVNSTGERAEAAMQTMPSTQKDPGFGVTPARDNSVEERNRVGRDYWVAMLKRYDNDPAKAWAAYNHGPGNFDDKLALAEKEGKAWIDLVPEETRNYVQKNMRLLNTGGGRAPMPTLDEGLARIREQTAGNPTQQAYAEELFRKQYGDVKKQVETQQNDAMAQAIELMQSGQSWAEVPTDLKAQIPPDKINTVRSAATNNETDYRVYDTFLQNPAEWAALSASQKVLYGQYISQPDMRKLDEIAANSDDIDRTVMTNVVNEQLTLFGYDVKSKDDDDLAEIGRQRALFTDVILSAQKSTGRKLNFAEMRKVAKEISFEQIQANGRMLPVLKFNSFYQIPPQQRKNVERVFTQEYGREPMDNSELVEFYRLTELTRNRKIREASAQTKPKESK